MEFTGERFIPELTDFNISYEHWHRYLYANSFIKNKRVLDIACGEGFGTYFLSKQAHTILGVDIDSEVIDYANQNYYNSNLKFLKGSATEIPVDTGSKFDVIISFETIEHITEVDQVKFLSEVKRLLKPDGIFIVSTPDKLYYSDIPNHQNQFHLKEFYRSEFESFLNKSFKHTAIVGQQIHTVSYISEPYKSSNEILEFNLKLTDQGFLPSEEPKKDMYMIAICSDEEINRPKTSIIFDPNHDYSRHQLINQTLFYDVGEGYNSVNRIVKSQYINGKEYFESSFDLSNINNLQGLKLEPCNNYCSIRIKNASLILKNNEIIELGYLTNACEIDDGVYNFNTDTPQINFEELDYSNAKELIIKLEYFTIGLASSVSILQNQISQSEFKKNDLEKEISNLQNQISHKVQIVTNLESRAEELANRIKISLDKQNSLRELNKNLSTKVNNLNTLLSNADKEIIKHKSELLNLNEKNKLETKKLIEQILILTGEQKLITKTEEKLKSQITNLKQSLRNSESDLFLMKDQLQQSQQKNQEIIIAILDLTKLITKKESNSESLTIDINKLKGIFSTLDQEINAYELKIPELQNRINNQETTISQKTLEIELLNRRLHDELGSLSYLLGRFLTYPARLLYDKIYLKVHLHKTIIVLKLILHGFKKPVKFISKINNHNIRVLKNALRHENPKQIFKNFIHFLNQKNVKKSSVVVNIEDRHLNLNTEIQEYSNPKAINENTPCLFPSINKYKVLFINNLDEKFDSTRYRVTNFINALKLVSIESESLNENEIFNNIQLINHFDIVVFFRVGWSPRIELILQTCKLNNIITVYDIDDYVFEPEIANEQYISGIKDWDEVQIKEYRKGVEDYRKVLLSCDFATTSTNFLKDRIEELKIPAFLIRNTLPKELIQISSSNRIQLMNTAKNKIQLVYMSGTKTHQADFAIIYKPLLKILEKYPQVELFIFGHLNLKEFSKLNKFSKQIKLQSHVHWSEMHLHLRDAIINLAPLEIENPFCEGKSELKYFEGSIYGLLTIASATQTFKEVIKNGKNGFLCNSEKEWISTLTELIEAPKLIQKIRENAFLDTILNYTPIALAEAIQTSYKSIIKAYRYKLGIHTNQLRISWIVPMPVAGSGGHNDIFIAANEMKKRGHDTCIYFVHGNIDKHPTEIKHFIKDQFGYTPLFRIVSGADQIKSSDALIATHFTTAYIVDNNRFSTYLPSYFIQDYEPFFNPVGSEYFEAEMTYQLNLFAISLGSWLADKLSSQFGHRKRAVDFWVNKQIYFPTKKRQFQNAENKNLIFFARPAMPRRAFNIGIKALELLHVICPEINITLFGSDEPIENYINFPFRNLKILSRKELADLYNEADIGLIFSTTNPSLLIYEAMACGLPVIDLDVNDSKFRHNDYPVFNVDPKIQDIAYGIKHLFDKPELRKQLSENSIEFTKVLPNINNALSAVSTFIEEEINGRIFK